MARVLREVMEAEALRLPAFQPTLNHTTASASPQHHQPYSSIALSCSPPQPGLCPRTLVASSPTRPALRHFSSSDGDALRLPACLPVYLPPSPALDIPAPFASSASSSSQAGPSGHPLLPLLDRASELLGCPAPSFYLHHYTRQDQHPPPPSATAEPPAYPRLCRLGPSSYRDCACVLLDRVAANLLLLLQQEQQQQEGGNMRPGRSRLLLTLVKDVATLLASISGTTQTTAYRGVGAAD